MLLFLLNYICSGILFLYSNEAQPISYQIQAGSFYYDLWGADGGAFPNQDDYRGKGAFISARIYCRRTPTLYFFIGQSPQSYLVLSESTKQFYCPGGDTIGGPSSSSTQVPGFYGTGGGGLTGISMFDDTKFPWMFVGSGGGSTPNFPGSPGGAIGECVTHSSDSQPTNPSFISTECRKDIKNGGTGSDSFFENLQYYSNGGGGAGNEGGKGGNATQSSHTYQFAGDGGSSFISEKDLEDMSITATQVFSFRGNEIPNLPLFHKESHHGQIKISKIVDCSNGVLEGCQEGEDCYCDSCSPHCYRCDPQNCLYCEPPYQLIEGKCEIFSELFTKSQDFTQSSDFSHSYVFNETAGFSRTFYFTNSLDFSHSSIFTKTVSFSKSFDFSQSCSFTPADNISRSVTFTKSSDFTDSYAFTETEGFPQTNNFSMSLTFSPQNSADSSSNNNNNIPIIVGSVVGLVVVAIIIVIVVIIVVRRKTAEESHSHHDMQETVMSMDIDEAKNDFGSHDNELINSENPYDPFMLDNMQLQE